MALSERKYRIDKYLEMARLTRNDADRAHFLDCAESWLEIDEAETKFTNSAVHFAQQVDVNDLLGQKTADVYVKQYVLFCQDEGETPLSKQVFSHTIKQRFDLVSMSKRFPGSKNARVYKQATDPYHAKKPATEATATDAKQN